MTNKKLNNSKSIIKSKNKKLLIIFLLYICGLKFTIILLLLALFLIAFAFPNDWSLVKRLVIAFVTFLAVNIVLAFIFFFFHIPLYPIYIGTLYIFIVGLYLLFIKKKFSVDKICTKEDLLYLTTPVLIFAVFFSGISHYGNGNRLPVMTDWDGGVHFAMVKLAVERKELLYGTHFLYNILGPTSILAYPPGFYVNTAITFLFFKQDINQDNILFLSNYYYIFSFFLIGVFLYIFGLLVDKYIDRSREFSIKIITIPFLFLFIFGFIILSLFYFGFFAQITSFIFLILLLYILENSKKDHSTSRFVFIMLLNFAISASWWVLTPVSSALCVYYLYKNINKKMLMIFIAGIIGSLIPIVYNLRDIAASNIDGIINAFNSPGGVFSISIQILTVLLLIAIGYVFFNKKNKGNIYLLLSIIFSGGYSFLIFILQMVTAGHVSYYFYKTLYSLTLFLFVNFMYLSYKSSNYYFTQYKSLFL